MFPKKKFKKLAINLIVLAIALIFALAVLEVSVRYLFRPELNLFDWDNFILYHGKKNIKFTTTTEDFVNNVSFNNYGFFDKDWKLQKDNDLRILVVGDSFTAGFNVRYEYNYARQLERMMKKDNISVDMMVAGTPSWDTSTEVKFLERVGLDFKPDIVIIQYYGNDVETNYLRKIFILEDGNLIDNTPISITFRKRMIFYLTSKSALFKRIYDFLTYTPYIKTLTLTLIEGHPPEYSDKECNYCNLFIENPDVIYSNGYNLTYKLLQKFSNMGKIQRFIPVLLIIPLKEQVYDEDWNKFASYSMIRDLNEKRIIKNSPKDILVINAYSYFANYNESIYFPNDIHLNEKGHAILAEILYSALANDTEKYKK